MNLSPSLQILFVDEPARSADFYREHVGARVLESSPTFAMLALGDSARLGLWSRHTAEPAPTTAGGGTELAFAQPDRGAVDQLHARWMAAGVPVAQAPVALDFGYTFVATDPDGHRLRVFHPEGD